MTKRTKLITASVSIFVVAIIGITIWRPAAILRLGLFRSLTVASESENNSQPQVLGAHVKSKRIFTRVFLRKEKSSATSNANSNTSANSNTNTSTSTNINSQTNANLNTNSSLNSNTNANIPVNTSTNTNTTPPPQPTQPTFSDSFSSGISVEETGSINESSSSNWWVNSGAWMHEAAGVGQTIQGSLSTLNPWRLDYGLSNPTDTDNGYYPQNIFRLVQRGSWTNFTQQAYFKIDKMNFSASENRNASNGLLFFNRYVDGNNLYYTGIRVDGAAVVKKKKSGTYYTMIYKKIFPGPSYNRDSVPNILPLDTWIGMRSVVKTNSNGTVTVELWTDVGKTGNWTLAVSTIDDNSSFGGKAITSAGHAGIRTDFLDAKFDDYSITEM